MILTVLSGKGGAGKTTITASLAQAMKNAVLVDADVDTPNLALALGAEEPVERREWRGAFVARFKGGTPRPDACPFGAIRDDGSVNELLCEGCGACAKMAPESYELIPVLAGYVEVYKTNAGTLVSADLVPGRSGSGKLVYEIRRIAEDIAQKEGAKHMLIDGAAGRGCPVIASIRGADRALLVIEDSVTGVNDAKWAVGVLKHFNVPFSFVINKVLDESRAKKIREEFEGLGGTYAGEIPYMEEIVRTYPVDPKPILKRIDVEGILQS